MPIQEFRPNELGLREFRLERSGAFRYPGFEAPFRYLDWDGWDVCGLPGLRNGGGAAGGECLNATQPSISILEASVCACVLTLHMYDGCMFRPACLPRKGAERGQDSARNYVCRMQVGGASLDVVDFCVAQPQQTRSRPRQGNGSCALQTRSHMYPFIHLGALWHLTYHLRTLDT